MQVVKTETKPRLLLKLKVILLMGCFALLTGCGGKSTDGDFLLGSWRIEDQSVHHLVTFRANHTWEAEVRTEGQYSKIVKKRGGVNGTWQVDQGRLNMTTLKAAIDIGWQEGLTEVFAILEGNKTILKLQQIHTGKLKTFKRVRSRKKDGQKDVAAAIVMRPIVVNLSKMRAHAKDRFLCVSLALNMNDPSVPSRVHPRVRETTLFYLSSLTYMDVNTNAKIDEVKGRLFSLLKPYMGDQFTDIDIRRVVVTTNSKKIESFLAADS